MSGVIMDDRTSACPQKGNVIFKGGTKGEGVPMLGVSEPKISWWKFVKNQKLCFVFYCRY